MKICPICNSEFNRPGTGSAIYCSPKCSGESIKRRSRLKAAESRITKTLLCGCCGTSFVSSNGVSKYCSKQCSYKMRILSNRRPKPAASLTKKCPVCSTSFTPVNSHHKYCSTLCSDEVLITRQNARRERFFEARFGDDTE